MLDKCVWDAIQQHPGRGCEEKRSNPVLPSTGESKFIQQSKEVFLSDWIERFGDVELEEYGWQLRIMVVSYCVADSHVVVMDASSFDEHTLRWRDNGAHVGR
jgi:hypothetical protein